jgi:putative toxin-antitoxin system antitoxin component (TIGR02293 family)
MKKYSLEQQQILAAEEPMAVYSTSGAVGASLNLLGGSDVFKGKTEITGKFDYLNIIRKGLSRKSLDYLMKNTGISALEMSDILHTTDRTLRRYTEDTVLNPEQSERALEIARLYTRGTEVFESLDGFKEWMNSSVVALGSKKPKEFLDTSLGIEILMEELGRIEHGIFA